MKEERSREQQIVRTSMVGIGTNLFLTTFKMIVGLLANSIAIMLDAMNNLSDALSSVITIVGMKMAGKPPDKNHPFGYGRVEYLSAIVITGLILFAGISFAITSVKKIITPDVTNYSAMTLVIVSIAIVTKLILGRYTKKTGERVQSKSLIASGSDATFDAVISVATLIGAIVAMTTHFVIDGWLGAAISIVIIKTGFGILMETLGSIVGRRADSALTKSIKKDLKTVDGILGAYDLVLHNYGPTNIMGSVNVEVYDSRTAKEIYTLSKKAQKLILEKYNIFLYIGIYAVNNKNDELNKFEHQVREDVLTHPYVLGVHAFYLEEAQKQVSFDMVVDFKEPDSLKLARQIREELEEKYGQYKFSIKIDRDFSD